MSLIRFHLYCMKIILSPVSSKIILKCSKILKGEIMKEGHLSKLHGLIFCHLQVMILRIFTETASVVLHFL